MDIMDTTNNRQNLVLSPNPAIRSADFSRRGNDNTHNPFCIVCSCTTFYVKLSCFDFVASSKRRGAQRKHYFKRHKQNKHESTAEELSTLELPYDWFTPENPQRTHENTLQ